MDFLEYIDQQHAKEKSNYNSDEINDSFSTYLTVQPKSFCGSCKYLIKKQDKAKLLLLCGKQRVYLSDSDIIKTIIYLPKEVSNWFLKQFTLAYQDNYVPFDFQINSTCFTGYGISKHPDDIRISLISDSEITINEFIFVINFVLFKDLTWKMKSQINDFHKRTLCKYITIIDCFVNNSLISKEYLNKIGYRIPSNPLNISDNKETKKQFLSVKMFDISNYL